ncbi:MAG TPA: hypothetical protein QF838_10695 [SAR202 cluster bacterium]|jgi:hypothetical protein|nr:hypothetical protein [SAR202 cluster bacterium]
MFRTKTLIIMTALMVSFLIPTVVFAETDTVTFGTAVVTNDQAVNDSLVVSMSGVAPPAEGSAYNAVLVSSDGTKSLDLGELSVVQPVIQGVIQATGTINFVYDSTSEGYDGEDLFATYSRIKLTNGSGGPTAYSDNVPVDAAVYINSAMSDINSIDAHLATAIAAAFSAQSSSDIDAMKTDIASAVANTSVISALADGLGANVTAAAAEDVEDSDMAEGAAGVIASAANISSWVNAAKATADNDVASQTSISVASIFAGKVFNELSAARNGWDANTDGTISSSTGEGGVVQARASAQQMATLTLEAKDLPEDEVATVSEDGTPVVVVVDSVLGLGLPSVGERIIKDLMLLSFLFGIAMVGIGSVILSRNRT